MSCHGKLKQRLQNHGCGSPIPTEVIAGGPSYNFTNFLSNSTSPPSKRAYSLTVPQDYDIGVAAPLILSFHGRGKNNLDQEKTSKFSHPFFNTKAIVVYPQGIDVCLRPQAVVSDTNDVFQLQWQGDPQAPISINDTLFISELVTHIEDRFCISSTQIFASGKSNGGGMVGQLACNSEMSGRIAAFAPVSGAFYEDFQGSCYPARDTVPILEFHGGSDKTINYLGGPDLGDRGDTVPIPQWLQQWAQRDQCDPTNKTVELINTAGKNNANRTTWTCGGETGLVSHYFSSYLGHVWPVEENAGYNATTVIMDFFNNLPFVQPKSRKTRGLRIQEQ